jgi:hypothetical protein
VRVGARSMLGLREPPLRIACMCQRRVTLTLQRRKH